MSSRSGGPISSHSPPPKESKWIPQPRRLLFPFLAPPAARLHALVAARRLKAVASAHAACSATAAGAVAAGSAAADSVIPLPSAASPPAAHHCQLSIVAQRAAAAHHCSCASFVLCHHAASIVSAAAAATHSLLEVRLLGKLGQPDRVGPRVSAVPVASPSALLRLQLSAARLIACALLLAQQRAPQKYLQQPTLTACTRFDPSAS